jgi:AcrR family transcriptional regulator
MSVKERRKREEKGRLRAILRAAERVFAKRGYVEARMDDIATTAELSKGTLYYYFQSKEEIFLELLKRETGKVHDEIRRRVSDDSSFSEALERTLGFYLEYFEKNRGFLRMFLPCMCQFVHFEGGRALEKSTRSYDEHGEFVRTMLKKKISREGLAFKPENLEKFIKTLQVGIGIKLLEGQKTEAEAAVRFFLDLIRNVMEDAT